ncbi:GNAT family N-acetyltransferase [Micrococcus sp.]|uniref:GNAT family N-acetyltransferase n=1 Tax=Micrococcus sp. TaxID=1271 RepID=UPI0026DAE50C|nr:GNAT family N-acetyltransferase [Micrococcus sp.]MDO4239050.1 GNAT family N-acetyltransferase [Micrococcus sp.]
MPDIIEIPLPTSADDPRWQDYCRLGREHNHELLGTTEWDESPEDALTSARSQPDWSVRRYLAYDAGTPVGHARSLVNTVDDPHSAALSVYVHPGHRGRGHGRALADRLIEDTAGMRRFETWPTTPPPSPGERTVTSSSGAGAVPADHPGVLFALAHGLTVAQVERISRYDLAAPAVDPATALAEAAAASPDYDVEVHEGVATPEVRPGVAVLKARMATDVPAGDRTVAEQTWDAARVLRNDQHVAGTGRLFRAVARHRGTGRIVGLNELVAPRSRTSGVVDQWDTIVLPEHRGHRLGMRVKAANVVALREAMPEARAATPENRLQK